jgi:hypothetical protein
MTDVRVLLAIVILAAVAAAPADARDFGRCHVRHDARGLARGQHAIVVEHPRPYRGQDAIDACLRAVGHWVVLTVDDRTNRTELVRVAGTRVAWVDHTPPVSGLTRSRDLAIADLRDRIVENVATFDDTAEEDSTTEGDIFPFGRVTDLELRSSQRFAFILRTHGTYIVERITPNFLTELDRSEAIVARSLHAEHTRICWRRGGRSRCAGFLNAR